MSGRRTLWLIGTVGLMLLLVGLGCSIGPFVSQPGPTPAEGEVTLPLEPTAVPTLTPTQEPPPGMSLYTDPLRGFSILYPTDWISETQADGIYFASTEEALASTDPAQGPLIAVMTGSPEEIALQFGPNATAEDLLNAVLEDLRGSEGAEIGEIEARTFGETPGVGVEISWTDEWTNAPLHGYIIAAMGDEVVGVGFGASAEADWASYGATFQDMFASLKFFPPELPEPVARGPIRPGETVQGTLPPSGTEMWTFDAQEGQYVTIRMDAVVSDTLDPYLELYNEDGVLITEDDDGGEGTNALISYFPVTASGTYSVHALTYSGEGAYTLSLEIADEPSASRIIAYGQTAQGTLAEKASDVWFFQGVEGDVVTIAMSALDEGLDCYLELYGPDGTALTEDDDSGEGTNALIEYYPLPADGTYRIIARGGLFGASGSYEITVKQTEMVVEGTLTYGETVSATLEPGTRHHWLFEGQEGDVVTISMTAVTEGMDTYLELFAPDGVRVMTDDDSGGDANAEISAFELPLSGTYRIIARGYDDGDVGEYELALTGP